MKKLLVTLLALTVVGLFAFADDAAPAPKPSIGNYSWAGATVYDSTGKQSYGPYVGWSISYDAGVAGFSSWLDNDQTNGESASTTVTATTTSGVTSYTGTTVVWGNYTVWGKLFDKKLKVEAGKLDDGIYASYKVIDTSSSFGGDFSGLAYSIQATPIDGLSVGFLNTLSTTSTAFSVSALGGGASYTLADIGTFKAFYVGRDSNLNASAEISAIKGSTIKAGFQYKSSVAAIYGAYSTSILDGKLWLGTDDTFTVGTGLSGKAKVQYDMGAFVPYATVSYTTSSSTYGVDAEVKFPLEGHGNVYTGVNVSSLTAGTWGIPLTVELWF